MDKSLCDRIPLSPTRGIDIYSCEDQNGHRGENTTLNAAIVDTCSTKTSNLQDLNEPLFNPQNLFQMQSTEIELQPLSHVLLLHKERRIDVSPEWVIQLGLSLIEATNAMHGRADRYLMDLSVENSICLDIEGCVKCLEIKRDVRSNKEIIIKKYLQNLKGESSIFLYAPEYLRSSALNESIDRCSTEEAGDVWAIGKIIQAFLLVHSADVSSTSMKMNSRTLEAMAQPFSSPSAQQLALQIFTSTFDRNPSKRMHLSELKSSLTKLLTLISSTHNEIRKTSLSNTCVENTSQIEAICHQIKSVIAIHRSSSRSCCCGNSASFLEKHRLLNQLENIYYRTKATFPYVTELYLAEIEADKYSDHTLHLSLALAYQREGLFSEALKHFTIYDQTLTGRINYGLVEKGEVQIALKDYKFAIDTLSQCDENDSRVISALSIALHLDGQHTAALELRRQIKTSSIMKTFNEKEYARFKRRPYFQTIEFALSIIRNEVSQSEFSGLLLRDLGLYYEAITEFQNCLVQQPKNLYCLLEISQCCWQESDALNYLELLIKKCKNEDTHLLSEAWFTLGVASKSKGFTLQSSWRLINWLRKSKKYANNQAEKQLVFAEILEVAFEIYKSKVSDTYLILPSEAHIEIQSVFYYSADDLEYEATKTQDAFVYFMETGYKFTAFLQCLGYKQLLSNSMFEAVETFNLAFLLKPNSPLVRLDYAAARGEKARSLVEYFGERFSTQCVWVDCLEEMVGWGRFQLETTNKVDEIANQIKSGDKQRIARDIVSKSLLNLSLQYTPTKRKLLGYLDKHRELFGIQNPNTYYHYSRVFFMLSMNETEEYAKTCLEIDPCHLPMLRLYSKLKDQFSAHRVNLDFEKQRRMLSYVEKLYEVPSSVRSSYQLTKGGFGYLSPDERWSAEEVLKQLSRDCAGVRAALDYYELGQVKLAVQELEKSEQLGSQKRSGFYSFVYCRFLGEGEGEIQKLKDGFKSELSNQSSDDQCIRFNLNLQVAHLLQDAMNHPDAHVLASIGEAQEAFDALVDQPTTSTEFKQKGAFSLCEMYIAVKNEKQARECLQISQRFSSEAFKQELRVLQAMVDIIFKPSMIVQSDIDSALKSFSAVQQWKNMSDRVIRFRDCLLNVECHEWCSGYCTHRLAIEANRTDCLQDAINLSQFSIDKGHLSLVLLSAELLHQSGEIFVAEKLLLTSLDVYQKNLHVIQLRSRDAVLMKNYDAAESWIWSFFEVYFGDSVEFKKEFHRIPQLFENVEGPIPEICLQIFHDIAVICEQAGNVNDQERFYRLILEQKGKDLKCCIGLIKMQLKQNTQELDDSVWTRYADMQSRDVRLWDQLAQLLFEKTVDYPKIITACMKSIQIVSNHQNAYYILGECYAKQKFGRILAEQAYHNQIASNPSHYKSLRNLGLLLIKDEQSQKNQGQKEEGILLLKKSLSGISIAEREVPFKVLIEEMISCNRELTELKECVYQYIEDFPDSKKSTLHLLARVYHKRVGNGWEVIEQYMAYLELEPADAQVIYTIACMHQALTMPEKAVEFFMKALAADERMWECHFRLGDCYLHPLIQNLEKAKEQILIGLTYNPTHALGLCYLGVVLMREKKYEEALTQFEESMHYCDGSINVLYKHLGRVYRKLRQHMESSICYSQAMKKFPDDKKIKLNFAASLLAQNKNLQASFIMQQVMLGSLNPLMMMKIYLQGQCEYQLNEFENANKQFERVLVHKQSKYFLLSAKRLLRTMLSENRIVQFKDQLDARIIEVSEDKNAEAYRLLAEINMYVGKMELAKEQLDNGLKILGDGQSVDFQLSLARYENLMGNHAIARVILDEMDEETKKSLDYDLLRCEVAIQCGEKTTILDHFEKLVAKPQESSILVQVRYLKGLMKSLNPKTVFECDIILQQNENHVPSQFLLLQLKYNSNKLYEAESIGTKAHLKNTGHLGVAKVLGEVYFEKKQYSKAIGFYAEYFKTCTLADYEIYKKYAISLMNEKEYSQADQIVKQCVKLSVDQTKDNDFLIILCQMMLQLKQFTEMKQTVEQYYGKNPLDPMVVVLYANAMNGLGESVEERRILEDGYTRFPSDLNVQHSLGNLYVNHADDYQKLQAILDQINDSDVSENDMLYDMGYWAYMIQDYRRSSSLLTVLNGKSTGNAKWISLLFKVLFILSSEHEAAIDLLIASNQSMKFEDNDLQLQISRWCFNRKKYTQAVEWCLKIKDPNDEMQVQKSLLIAQGNYVDKKFKKAKEIVSILMAKQHKQSLSSHDKMTIEILLERIEQQSRRKGTDSSSNKSIQDRAVTEGMHTQMKLLLIKELLQNGLVNQAQKIIDESRVDLEANLSSEEFRLLQLWVKEASISSSSSSSSIQESNYDINEKDSATLVELDGELEEYLYQFSQTEFSLMLLGRSSFFQKDYHKAVEQFRKCIEQVEKPLPSINCWPLSVEQIIEVLFLLGQAYRLIEYSELARATFQECIDLAGYHEKATLLLAKLHLGLKEYNQAVYVLHIAREQQEGKQNANFMLMLAQIRAEQGNYNIALNQVDKAMAVSNQAEDQSRVVLEQIAEMACKNPVKDIDVLISLKKLLPQHSMITKHLILLYHELKDVEKVIELIIDYEKMMNGEIIDVEVIVVQVEVMLATNNPEQASLALEKGLSRSDPNEPQLQFAAGLLARYLGDYKKEIQVYSQIIDAQKLSSNSAEIINRARFSQANAYMYTGEYAESEKIYSGMLVAKNANTDFVCLFNYAVCLFVQGKLEKAEEYCNRALFRKKNEKNALVLFALIKTKTKQNEMAIGLYQKCLDLYPGFIPAIINLAILYRKTKEFYKAIQVLVRAQTIHPKNLVLSYHLALTHLCAKVPSMAVSVLRETLFDIQTAMMKPQVKIEQQQKHYSASGAAVVASVNWDLFNFSQAIKHGGELINKNSNNTNDKQQLEVLLGSPKKSLDVVSVNLLLALSLRKDQRFEEAIIHLEQCIRGSYNKPNVSYYYNYALAHGEKGDLERAHMELVRCAKLQPELSHLFQFAFSNLLHDGFHLDDEIIYLNQCIRNHSDYYFALVNLGCALVTKKKFPQAIALFRRAIAAKPTDPDAHFNLGSALTMSRDFEGAIDAYQICLEVNPAHKKCLNNLSLVFSLSGQAENAIATLQKYAEIEDDLHQRMMIFNKLEGLHKKYLIDSICQN